MLAKSKNATTKSKNATKKRKKCHQNNKKMRAMPEKCDLPEKNPLSVKNAFLMPAQLPDGY